MSFPTFLGAFTTPQDLPKKYERAFVCVGRSNVGKSSFVNALTSSKISKVSSNPGRTQTINVFSLSPNSALIDVPGYGYAKHSKELRQELETRIFATLTNTQHLKRVFLVIDAFVGLTALDQEMIAFLTAEHIAFTVLANKADKLNQRERAQQEKTLHAQLPADASLLFCSAKTGTGFGEIRQLLNADS